MILRVSLVTALVLSIYSPLIAQDVDCIDGKANGYPCASITLKSFLSISDMGGGRQTTANDIWGWTDTETGKEYALVGLYTGTAFVDVSDPNKPLFLGSLATHTSNSSWRDIKVFNDHAFIVSEASNHGMQIFDLKQLALVNELPVTFSATAHYDEFGAAHNIVVNEDSGFAYAVGSSTCAGGLHMIDIKEPTKPLEAGCFSDDGYTHDAQCVIYSGLDPDYQGREICVNSNEDTITVVDVTDKANAIQIAREGYPNSQYVHQGWFSEDQRYFYQNDELDRGDTRTVIWDMKDLDEPFVAGNYYGPSQAYDHNLYSKGHFVYEANYTAGLRILDVSDPEKPVEVAYFDTYPSSNAASFEGAWSSYPYFESGNVIISSIGEGLFVVKPELNELPVELVRFEALVDGERVLMSWETASEKNNAGFEVEQLVNGAFIQVGFVEGHGTSDTGNAYSFEVKASGFGQHSFRLKQIDFDGTFEYSKSVSVILEQPASIALSKAYPNPFNPMTVVSISVARAQQVTVEAFNYQGQRVGELYHGAMEANVSRDIRFDAGHLPSGFYFIRATGDHEIVTQSVTLVK